MPVSLETWAAFAAAAAVLVVIPGPTVMLVASYALAAGRGAAPALVAGVALGDLVGVTLSFAGLGAVLAASATLFNAVKWAGAAYLVYLGVRMWMAPTAAPEIAPQAVGATARRMFGHAFAVTALNPKGMVFFVAFVPQFLDAGRPLLPQMILLGATFVVLGGINAGAYAWLAGGVRRAALRPGAMKLANRVGGGVLIAAGALAARQGA
jgi:threonine/homoserine/homoserine lactone efflux protein